MRKTIGLALIALVALLVLLWQTVAPTGSEHAEQAPAVPAPQATQPRPEIQLPERLAAGPPDQVEPVAAPPSAASSAFPVDLEQLRRRLPDNLYWTLGAPTEDRETLRERDERARRSNELYGKVLSSTASDEEIAAYYAERRRVSEDYIEFSALVLAEYRDQLPEEQVGLYELSINLHRARLVEIERDKGEALARRRARGAP